MSSRSPASSGPRAWLIAALALSMAGAAWATAARPDAWFEIIDRYLAGDYAAATRALDDWLRRDTAPELTAAMARLREDVVTSPRQSGQRRLAVRRLQAAVLVPLESLLPLSARVADEPRFSALEDALRQALGAVAIVERTGDADLGAFRMWAQIGLMQFLLDSGRLEDAEGVAQGMRVPANLPNVNVEHHLLRGIIRERAARIVIGARGSGFTYLDEASAGAPGPTGAGSAAGGVTVRVDRGVVARRYWASAARWYEQVLEVAPDHVEARLRLARTWLDRDQPARAITLLAPLITRPCSSLSCSLAVLFTGESHERRGDLAEAATAYRQAAGDAPTRQSAVIALLGLSLHGHGEDALTLARTFASDGPPADGRPDAWGAYVGGRRGDPDVVLAPLRRGLAK